MLVWQSTYNKKCDELARVRGELRIAEAELRAMKIKSEGHKKQDAADLRAKIATISELNTTVDELKNDRADLELRLESARVDLIEKESENQSLRDKIAGLSNDCAGCDDHGQATKKATKKRKK